VILCRSEVVGGLVLLLELLGIGFSALTTPCSNAFKPSDQIRRMRFVYITFFVFNMGRLILNQRSGFKIALNHVLCLQQGTQISELLLGLSNFVHYELREDLVLIYDFEGDIQREIWSGTYSKCDLRR
jgi:hypothetical protein